MIEVIWEPDGTLRLLASSEGSRQALVEFLERLDPPVDGQRLFVGATAGTLWARIRPKPKIED